MHKTLNEMKGFNRGWKRYFGKLFWTIGEWYGLRYNFLNYDTNIYIKFLEHRHSGSPNLANRVGEFRKGFGGPHSGHNNNKGKTCHFKFNLGGTTMQRPAIPWLSLNSKDSLLVHNFDSCIVTQLAIEDNKRWEGQKKTSGSLSPTIICLIYSLIAS